MRAEDDATQLTSGVYWFAGDERWRLPDDVTPLITSVRTDVGIVGGGFTGLGPPWR